MVDIASRKIWQDAFSVSEASFTSPMVTSWISSSRSVSPNLTRFSYTFFNRDRDAFRYGKAVPQDAAFTSSIYVQAFLNFTAYGSNETSGYTL